MFPHLNHPPNLEDCVTPFSDKRSLSAERLSDLLKELESPGSVAHLMLLKAFGFSPPESGRPAGTCHLADPAWAEGPRASFLQHPLHPGMPGRLTRVGTRGACFLL